MPNLSDHRIEALLAPYLGGYTPAPTLIPALSTYLDLLLKWNARTNLTAIRDPEEIVQRHFGESLFTGLHLRPYLEAHNSPSAESSQLNETPFSSLLSPQSPALLDFGSGAGFPGLPIQLLLPQLHVTLAESQNKKASFLREVVRTLALPTEIWSARAETLPPTRQFTIITLRAVDNMAAALAAATPRLAPGGHLAILGTDLLASAITIPLPTPSHGYLSLLSSRT